MARRVDMGCHRGALQHSGPERGRRRASGPRSLAPRALHPPLVGRASSGRARRPRWAAPCPPRSEGAGGAPVLLGDLVTDLYEGVTLADRVPPSRVRGTGSGDPSCQHPRVARPRGGLAKAASHHHTGPARHRRHGGRGLSSDGYADLRADRPCWAACWPRGRPARLVRRSGPHPDSGAARSCVTRSGPPAAASNASSSKSTAATPAPGPMPRKGHGSGGQRSGTSRRGRGRALARWPRLEHTPIMSLHPDTDGRRDRRVAGRARRDRISRRCRIAAVAPRLVGAARRSGASRLKDPVPGCEGIARRAGVSRRSLAEAGVLDAAVAPTAGGGEPS